MYRTIIQWVILIAWVIFISVLSLLPSGNFNTSLILFHHFDKVIHFIFYFVFALFTFRLLTGISSYKARTIALLSATIPVVYSGVIELMQEYLIVSRNAEFLDFIVNMAGAILGSYMFRYGIRRNIYRAFAKEFF